MKSMAIIALALIVNMPSTAQDATGDSIYFAGVFDVFDSVDQAATAQATNPTDRDIVRKAAATYWVKAVNNPLGEIKRHVDLLDKAQEAAEMLWKLDHRDYRTMYVLANVYMSRCAALSITQLDEILANLNKAQSNVMTFVRVYFQLHKKWYNMGWIMYYTGG